MSDTRVSVNELHTLAKIFGKREQQLRKMEADLRGQADMKYAEAEAWGVAKADVESLIELAERAAERRADLDGGDES